MTTTMDTPEDIKFFQACSLRGALRLQMQGMKHSRMTNTQVRASVGKITGKKYKRTEDQRALDDINAWIKEQKAARGDN